MRRRSPRRSNEQADIDSALGGRRHHWRLRSRRWRLGAANRVNAVWLVTAALSVYFIAYRFYASTSPSSVLQLDDTRPTPAMRHNDGMDYVPTNKWVLYGHHFAAIAGAGPLVGPVLAAQMGFLPGTLWILAGVVVAGAVQDFIVLFASVRRDGKSLGEMIKMELGPLPGSLALGRRAGDHDHHPGGAEPHCGQGADRRARGDCSRSRQRSRLRWRWAIYMRVIRPGRVGEASVFGVVAAARVLIFYGRNVAAGPDVGAAVHADRARSSPGR